MINDLLQQFMNSPAAAEALKHLQDNHGLDASQAQQALESTAHATGQAAASPDAGAPQIQQFGALGNAVVGGIGGLVSGQGVLKGGLSSVVAGKAAEMIAQRTGMSPGTASTVAAAAAPFILKYLQGQTGGASSSTPQEVHKEQKPQSVTKQSK